MKTTKNKAGGKKENYWKIEKISGDFEIDVAIEKASRAGVFKGIRKKQKSEAEFDSKVLSKFINFLVKN